MGAASTAASSKMEGTESSSSFMGSAHAVRGHTLNALEQRSGWSAIARNAYECVTRGVWGVSSVQSLFELTNSKPTKLALKAVPSEQLECEYQPDKSIKVHQEKYVKKLLGRSAPLS